MNIQAFNKDLRTAITLCAINSAAIYSIEFEAYASGKLKIEHFVFDSFFHIVDCSPMPLCFLE